MLKTFVVNWVGEIQTKSNISDWRHVPTADNPADLITRGQTLKKFLRPSIWKNGPEWLHQTEEHWPIGTQLRWSKPIAWCSVVDLIMEEGLLQGSALFSVLSSTLEGSASRWLTQVLTGEKISWSRFKELFITRFGDEETTTSSLITVARE